MNIAIVGGRDFVDYELLKNELVKFIDENEISPDAIFSGGAKGADSLAEKFAAENGFEMVVYKPEYEKFGRDACHARNTQIVEHSDVVFTFWDGKSKGTLDSINKAKKLEKRLFIVNY